MLKSYLIVIAIINVIGLYIYFCNVIKSMSYKKQFIIDFFMPIGAIIGRLLFRYSIKDNKLGYIYGLIFLAFITIMFIIG